MIYGGRDRAVCSVGMTRREMSHSGQDEHTSHGDNLV